MLRRDELDAALVSITEVLLNDRYDILDGVAIASLGEVFSVILAHKKPIEEATEIFCDTASLTSVNLLKVLLAERNLFPKFVPLENYEAATEKYFVLLIGNPAIDFQRLPGRSEVKADVPDAHKIFDWRGMGRDDKSSIRLCGMGVATRNRKQGTATESARREKIRHGIFGLRHRNARGIRRGFPARLSRLAYPLSPRCG